MSVARWIVVAAALSGCGLLPAYLDVGAGAVAGASEANGFGAGPVLGLALGMAFDATNEPLLFGIGFASDVASQRFTDFDYPALVAGLALDASVPIVELDPSGVYLSWQALVTLGGGGLRLTDPLADGEVRGEFGASVFSGLGVVYRYGPANINMLSVMLGPYGMFLGHPGAYGGGMLRLRFGFWL